MQGLVKALLEGKAKTIPTKHINRLQVVWDFAQDVADLSLVGDVDLYGRDFTPSLDTGALVSIHAGVCNFLQWICPACKQYKISTALQHLV